MAVWHGGNLARFVYITLGVMNDAYPQASRKEARRMKTFEVSIAFHAFGRVCAALLLLAPAIGSAQSQYELVDAQVPMCHLLVKALNDLPSKSPMSCRRTI